MVGKVREIVFTTAFGSYQAQRVIGEGGTGWVYEVTDADGSQYAAKCLRPALATTTRRKRFRNECLFCERNEHKNVIRVLEYGTATIRDESCPFYVMPYYPTTLRGLMREGLDHEKVLPLFSQMLDGVEAAHKLGVYHRDLKPENILYDPDSDVLVVSDLGIAHFAEA
jgi:serine/threonine protein kinase